MSLIFIPTFISSPLFHPTPQFNDICEWVPYIKSNIITQLITQLD